MRYRLMATYLGVPYHAGLGPDGNDATLFSPAPPPDELGFTAGSGHWRKQVSVTDLDALWQSRLVGEYRGEPCLVLDDLGDRLHIAYLGRDSARARHLGYWEIDREVFEVVVARQEVTGLTEERVEYPLASAMFPPSNRDPVPAAALPRPEGPGRGAPAPHAAPPRLPPPVSGLARCGPCRGRAPCLPRSRGDLPRPIAARVRRTGSRPGMARPRPSPGLSRGQVLDWIPRLSPGRGRRRPRRPDGGPGGGTGCLSRSLPNSSAWPPSRTRRTRSTKEVPGAMCLVKADGGFEVFSRTDDARLDVRFFEDEEAAYFYLFGVLAAEAVRSGRLRPCPPNGRVNGSRGPGVPAASGEKLSKYLRREKLPKSASRTVIV